MLRSENNPKVLAAIAEVVKGNRQTDTPKEKKVSESLASRYTTFKPTLGQEQNKQLSLQEELSPKQKKIAKVAGHPAKIDAADFKALRAGKKVEEEVDQQDEAMSHQAKTTMKHIPNPSPALKKAAKDIKPGVAGYRDRIAMLKAGGVKEDVEQVQELKASTLGSYIKKAAYDAKGKGFDAGSQQGWAMAKSKEMFGGVEAGTETDDKAHKRLSNIKKATNKLVAKSMKEQADLDEARGRPRKNPLPASKGDDEYGAGNGKEPDQHIHVQLKTASDMEHHEVKGKEGFKTKGGADVKFDGGTHFVHSDHAKKVLSALDKLKPADREKMHAHIQQSHANFMAVHKLVS